MFFFGFDNYMQHGFPKVSKFFITDMFYHCPVTSSTGLVVIAAASCAYCRLSALTDRFDARKAAHAMFNKGPLNLSAISRRHASVSENI